MNTLSTEMTALEKAVPRIALLLTDSRTSLEIQEIFREKYSCLMLVSELDKLREFDYPLVVFVDNIKDAASVRSLKSSSEARILIVSNDEDSELIGAAFEVGADDYVCYPFATEEVLNKTENILKEIVE